MILAHNHPSGNLRPSKQDKDLTDQFKKAGQIMNIDIIDHIILSPYDNEYYSFLDEYGSALIYNLSVVTP